MRPWASTVALAMRPVRPTRMPYGKSGLGGRTRLSRRARTAIWRTPSLQPTRPPRRLNCVTWKRQRGPVDSGRLKVQLLLPSLRRAKTKSGPSSCRWSSSTCRPSSGHSRRLAVARAAVAMVAASRGGGAIFSSARTMLSLSILGAEGLACESLSLPSSLSVPLSFAFPLGCSLAFSSGRRPLFNWSGGAGRAGSSPLPLAGSCSTCQPSGWPSVSCSAWTVTPGIQ